ncbi:hypothetical protein GE061_003596 [Apolygus lucorum]|uniref:Uncharacterized protein n=1 Tax=Apolygus lucorum TaxID=248454 RepID=A0A8S9X3Y8_APOLU|nr:hypothetical protein GE061_003596 [Apolygus lucorum]
MKPQKTLTTKGRTLIPANAQFQFVDGQVLSLSSSKMKSGVRVKPGRGRSNDRGGCKSRSACTLATVKCQSRNEAVRAVRGGPSVWRGWLVGGAHARREGDALVALPVLAGGSWCWALVALSVLAAGNWVLAAIRLIGPARV